jgi:glycerol-3-phosphate dehydrogenase
VHDLAAKLSCEMPLHEAVYRILYEDLAPRAAMAQLTSRELKSEFAMH